LPIALRPKRHRLFSGIFVALGIVGFTVVILLNTVFVDAVRDIPYVNRLSQALDLESVTAQVRAYIWEGSSNLVRPHEPLVRPDGDTDTLNAVRPLVGYGPEAMWVAFNKFYPPGLTLVE